jgi:SAM-dependent methyltransferase
MSWFETKKGLDLILLEKKILNNIFDQIFGFNILQVGDIPSLVDESRFKYKLDKSNLSFNPSSLPFDNDSIDCVVYPHQDTDNILMLQEAYRVLIPQGYAIFINFNPWSLMGIKTFFSLKNEFPWNQTTESFTSFQNKVLENGFEIINGKFFGYHPSFKSASYSSNWDKIGDRWFPIFANIYLLVVRKKIITLTPIKPSWKSREQKNQVKVSKKYDF